MSAPPGDYWDTLPLGEGVARLTVDPNGLAAFAKPSGVLSHPNEPADEPRSLLVCHYDKEAQCYRWKGSDGTLRRLWLLNRLDSATSGVLLVAAGEELAATVREHFARKQVHKVYHALVFGRPARAHEVWKDLLAVTRQEGRIRTSARGNIPAETRFELLQHSQRNFSTALVRLEPRTGRSHQLRVQCARRQLPIVGDQTYGDFALNRAFTKATGSKRLFLHSLETAFTYEFAGRRHTFRAAAPLPEDFRKSY